MKNKKLWITTASFGITASLLATVLTSCSASKIDDDQKITLNDEGKLYSGNNMIDDGMFSTAIKNALGRSSSWATFKQALADELVLQWYQDRAAEHEDDKDKKNVDFKLNLNKWEYDNDDEYDDIVQSCKDKYSSNYKFYLQNEYLAPNGGTSDSWKHAQLVKKAKDEFISKVWENNYFGWSSDYANTSILPRYFADASMTIDNQDLLNNPKTWNQLGFYATVNPEYGFLTKPTSYDQVDTNFLARNPDGDYATIQDYVFNRWFETERPFFSAAALFKYSAPKWVSKGKLDEIYSTTSIGVTLPDAPNESYPFFGGVDVEKQGTGTRAYLEWFENLEKGKFFSSFKDGATPYSSNGTVTIPASNTEDSQTLLLSYGSQMIGGSSSLYVPYATAAANLYLDMVLAAPITNNRMNVVTKAWLEKNLSKGYDVTAKKWNRYTIAECYHDNVTSILQNFFVPGTQITNPEVAVTPKVITPYKPDTSLPEIDFGTFNSYVDLKKLSGGAEDSQGYFHSKLFNSTSSDEDFDFFYGRNEVKDGIRFLVNTLRVNDLTSKIVGEEHSESQPWILELNESGMHAQTIDGYEFVTHPEKYLQQGLTRKEALKNVIKYRLMQKKCKYNDALISGDVFGDNGALKTYFTNNFADIILELALRQDEYNIFRSNENYNKEFAPATEKTLFQILCENEGFDKAKIASYIQDTDEYDLRSKYVDGCNKANDTIYAYRKDQITNTKFKPPFVDVYKNGLLAPLAYDSAAIVSPSDTTDIGRTHEYCISPITYIVWGTDGFGKINQNFAYSGTTGLGAVKAKVDTDITNLVDWANIPLNSTGKDPFSPQINSAKKAGSNRFWYKSGIVDKFAYSTIGNVDTIANQIKVDSYKKYVELKDTGDFATKFLNDEAFQRAMASTWSSKQLFTAEKNYSSYFGVDDVKVAGKTFFSLVNDTLKDKQEIEFAKDGQYNATYNAYQLFLATLMYLTMDTGTTTDPEPFGNFYKVLNSQIGEDEAALVGYVNKVNPIVESIDDPTLAYKNPTLYITADGDTAYNWTPNVSNMYDQIGYASGGINPAKIDNSKVAADQYWNVLYKGFRKTDAAPIYKTLAGFTGLQTKSSNNLDDIMDDAAFDLIAQYTSGSRNLAVNTPELEAQQAASRRYQPNHGAWFAYAGKANAKGRIGFDDFSYTKDGTTYTIKASDFDVTKDGYDTGVCLRLAKKMRNYSSMQDLKTLAKSLGESYYGESIYRQIGSGERSFTDINEMKFEMLKALPKKGSDGNLSDEYNFFKCFQRLSNVEIHELGQDQDGQEGKLSYCFDDKNGNGYKLMLTQINKADVVEQTLAPEWVGGAWQDTKSPLTLDEFFYLLCDTACESSVQSLAITQVVKAVFGDDKLQVYDANLYNAFDSIWIKDWVKKPMGS